MDEQDLQELARVVDRLHDRAVGASARADFSDRVMVAALDLVIVFVCLFAGGILIGAIEWVIGKIDQDWLVVISVAAVWLLGALELTGASAAKSVFGFRVAALDGSPALFHRLLVRWVIKSLPLGCLTGAVLAYRSRHLIGVDLRSWTDLLVTAMWIRGGVLAAGEGLVLSSQRRALHDHLAGTCVLPKARMRKDVFTGEAFQMDIVSDGERMV